MSFEHRYSDDIQNKKIAILGIMPPPYGGVSVHIRRVADKLLHQGNTVLSFNIEQSLRALFPAYLIKLFFWIIWHRPDHIYYHGSYLRWCAWELGIILFLQKILKHKTIIVEHDCRHLYKRSSLFKKIYKWMVLKLDMIVLIGDSALQSYKDNQITLGNYSIEGAFLPPVLSVASIIEQTYPSSLFDFIKVSTPVLLMNAAHIMKINNVDIYGFDLAFSMIAQIKATYPDVGLIIGLAHADQHRYKALCDQMSKLEIMEHIYVLHDQKELWPLYKYIDVFIRPTRSDGASISLQEALYFKVPSIASNCVTRPDHTETFQNNDVLDFVFHVNKILSSKIYVS